MDYLKVAAVGDVEIEFIECVAAVKDWKCMDEKLVIACMLCFAMIECRVPRHAIMRSG